MVLKGSEVNRSLLITILQYLYKTTVHRISLALPYVYFIAHDTHTNTHAHTNITTNFAFRSSTFYTALIPEARIRARNNPPEKGLAYLQRLRKKYPAGMRFHGDVTTALPLRHKVHGRGARFRVNAERDRSGEACCEACRGAG